ncbi:MAG: HU family DNA-binding protein [Acidobacteriota bacterium]
MTKRQLIEALVAHAALDPVQARRAVETLFGGAAGEGVLAAALVRGERISLAGFGVFLVRERGPRQIIDPRTHSRRELSATRVASFRPALALKDLVRR